MRYRLLPAIIATAAVLAACGSSSSNEGGDNPVGTVDGSSVQVNEQDGTVSVDVVDDEGNPVAEMFTGSVIPDQWPSSIPVPADVDVQLASQMPMGNGMSFGFTGVVVGDPVAVTEAWLAQLAANGYVEVDVDRNDLLFGFVYESGEYRIEGTTTLIDVDPLIAFGVTPVG